MALPRAGHWGANCHLEGQKSNHSFFITYRFPSLPLPIFTLFLPPVVGSLDTLWLLWFNCTLKLSAGISSCSFRKINSVSRDQIPWRSKSWTCSGALINFKLVWACSFFRCTQEKEIVAWLELCVWCFHFIPINSFIHTKGSWNSGKLPQACWLFSFSLLWLAFCDNTNKCSFISFSVKSADMFHKLQ